MTDLINTDILTKSEYQETEYSLKQVPKIERLVKIEIPEITYYENITTLKLFWELIKLSPKLISLTYYIIKFINYLKESTKMTQNTIDTVKGIIRALAAIAGILGYTIAPNQIDIIIMAITSIWGLVEMVLGMVSNSKHVKPETK
jgi:hypothetical protein